MSGKPSSKTAPQKGIHQSTTVNASVSRRSPPTGVTRVLMKPLPKHSKSGRKLSSLEHCAKILKELRSEKMKLTKELMKPSGGGLNETDSEGASRENSSSGTGPHSLAPAATSKGNRRELESETSTATETVQKSGKRQKTSSRSNDRKRIKCSANDQPEKKITPPADTNSVSAVKAEQIKLEMARWKQDLLLRAPIPKLTTIDEERMRASLDRMRKHFDSEKRKKEIIEEKRRKQREETERLAREQQQAAIEKRRAQEAKKSMTDRPGGPVLIHPALNPQIHWNRRDPLGLKESSGSMVDNEDSGCPSPPLEPAVIGAEREKQRLQEQQRRRAMLGTPHISGYSRPV